MGWPGGRISVFPAAFDDLFPGSIISEFRDNLLACFPAGNSNGPRQTCDLRDGTLWWRFSLQPITERNARSTTRRILVTGCDMLETAKTKEAPETTASRYHTLVDLAYDAIVTMDSRHKITLFNRAAENLWLFFARSARAAHRHSSARKLPGGPSEKSATILRRIPTRPASGNTTQNGWQQQRFWTAQGRNDNTGRNCRFKNKDER